MTWTNTTPNPLVVGGSGVSGRIEIYNASGVLIGTIDDTGLQVFNTLGGNLWVDPTGGSATQPTIKFLPDALVGHTLTEGTIQSSAGASWLGTSSSLELESPGIDGLVTASISLDSSLLSGSGIQLDASATTTTGTLAVATDLSANRAAFGGVNALRGVRGAATAGPAAAASFSTAVSFGVTLPAIPAVFINLNSGAGATNGWIGRAISVSTTGFTLFGTGAVSTFSASWQWAAVLEAT